MKMLNNGLEVDGFATSRTPIPSPRSTKMGEGDRRYVARPPEPPAQVHPDHDAEDGAVAVAEHVAVVEPVDEVAVLREQKKKRYKNSGLPSTVLVPCVADVDTRCVANVEAPNANAPRLDDHHHVDVESRVGRRRSSWMSKKASSC